MFLRYRLRRAARKSKGYEQNEIAFLRRHPHEAVQILIEDLAGEPTGSTYRINIPTLLACVRNPDAEQACLRLLKDTNESSSVRGNTVNAVFRMGLAGQAPFFDALLSCVNEKGGYVEYEAARVLCETHRSEVIPNVCALLFRCPDRLRENLTKALTSLDANWATMPEARGIIPDLDKELRGGDLKKAQFAIQCLSKIDSAEVVDVLLEFWESRGQFGQMAEETLSAIARKYDRKDVIHKLNTAAETRREQQRLADEQRKAAQEKRENEAFELRSKLRLGMSLDDIQMLLGAPSSNMSGGAVLGRLGAVSGSADTVASISGRQYYMWRRPEGEWKLVFVGGKLEDIYSTPRF